MAAGVVITGVSSGIGQAAAFDLDRRGFRVFGGVRKPEDAEAIRSHASERFTPLLLDVTDAGAIARARETVDEQLGSDPLAGVVNNPGSGWGGADEGRPLGL